jgi:hypothetical protein
MTRNPLWGWIVTATGTGVEGEPNLRSGSGSSPDFWTYQGLTSGPDSVRRSDLPIGSELDLASTTTEGLGLGGEFS